ncbi:MAG: ATP-binding cassette domain-containing protein, partial [Lachnospiraceae bacterium]|nr:ATP-binding cassette domain-containing protein [Lachnospiraceae bacterium]
SLYTVIYEAMTIAFPVLVLLAGFLLREKDLVSVGAVVAIYSIVGLMQEPMREMADSVTLYKENANREKKLGEIVEPYFGEEIIPAMNKINVEISALDLGGKTLLENVCFEINRGDVVSLQGPSGCGKSTLLKLLIGFVRYEGCKCYYDGVLQDEIPDEVRYANISLVEQRPFLFTASIKENIFLGEEFGEELLDEVLRTCALEEMVAQYGLEKEIDWAGGNVSGGEMQRITIARTIIRKPRFLLLDEVTASLDAKNAEEVAQNIVVFAKKYNIAIVAVSHKDEFVKLSNKKVSLSISEKTDEEVEKQKD